MNTAPAANGRKGVRRCLSSRSDLRSHCRRVAACMHAARSQACHQRGCSPIIRFATSCRIFQRPLVHLRQGVPVDATGIVSSARGGAQYPHQVCVAKQAHPTWLANDAGAIHHFRAIFNAFD